MLGALMLHYVMCLFSFPPLWRVSFFQGLYNFPMKHSLISVAFSYIDFFFTTKISIKRILLKINCHYKREDWFRLKKLFSSIFKNSEKFKKLNLSDSHNFLLLCFCLKHGMVFICIKYIFFSLC